MVVMVSVCALDSYHLCAPLFLALPVLRTELDSYGKVWLGFDTDLRKYIKCTHFNIPMYASKLNLYTKLHIYWILPNTFVCYVMYGTISQTLVNIRCLLCSGSAAILTFIFNGHRQSYKIHFQLASLHSSCVCVDVLLLFFIELTFCKWEKIQFIFYNRTFITGGRGAKNKGQNAIWKRRENKIDRATVCMRDGESPKWLTSNGQQQNGLSMHRYDWMRHVSQRRPTDSMDYWMVRPANDTENINKNIHNK